MELETASSFFPSLQIYKGTSPVCTVRVHYIISKSDILKINCSSIALFEKCNSQETEPLQGAYDKI